MPKRLFTFSPSVQLILTNLPTIRPILKVFDEGTVKQEVKQFLKHLKSRLDEDIPEVKTWDSYIAHEKLYISPQKSWHVVKDDDVAIVVDMEQYAEPCLFDDEDDPFVGVYVPGEWKHIQRFTAGLKQFRIPGFEHISDRSDGDDLDERFPLWSTIRLTTFVKQKTLDIPGLEKAMIDRARELVANEGKISKIISKLRQNVHS